jgi:dihydrofolate reductase
MRKLVLSEFVTLDGVMQGPGNDEPNFERRGWNIPYMNEEAAKYKEDELLAADALLLGEITYRGFAKSWPNIEMGVISDRMNGMKKYVVSPTLKPAELTWNNSEHIKENIVEELKKLKAAPGKDILVYGSGQLAQALIQNDLIDEYRLQLHPIILGEGKRLFGEGLDQKTLEFVSAKTVSTGIVLLTYKFKPKS